MAGTNNVFICYCIREFIYNIFPNSSFIFIESIDNTPSKNIIFSLLCGIFIALAQRIRPVAQMLILVLFISGFVIIKIKKKNGFIEKTYLIILVSFIITILIMNAVIKFLTGVPLRWSIGYNFMVGTNLKSHDVYNNKDALILGKYNYDFKKFIRKALKLLLKELNYILRDF